MTFSPFLIDKNHIPRETPLENQVLWEKFLKIEEIFNKLLTDSSIYGDYKNFYENLIVTYNLPEYSLLLGRVNTLEDLDQIEESSQNFFLELLFYRQKITLQITKEIYKLFHRKSIGDLYLFYTFLTHGLINIDMVKHIKTSDYLAIPFMLCQYYFHAITMDADINNLTNIDFFFSRYKAFKNYPEDHFSALESNISEDIHLVEDIISFYRFHESFSYGYKKNLGYLSLKLNISPWELEKHLFFWKISNNLKNE